MAKAISTNTFGVAKWVVSPDATQGTHTTMTAAMVSAQAGDTVFVRDGNYVEDWVITPGVTIVALGQPDLEANVIFTGSIYYSGGAGNLSAGVIGCEFVCGDGDSLNFTGNIIGEFVLTNCSLTFAGAGGINFLNNQSSQMSFVNCIIDSSTDDVSLITSSSPGQLQFNDCSITNSGNSDTASSISGGTLLFYATICQTMSPIILSSTASMECYYSSVSTDNINTAFISMSGTSYCQVQNSNISSGTAACITVGSTATCQLITTNLASSNTNAISGSGALSYGDISFFGTSTQFDSSLSLTLLGSTPANAAADYVWTSTGVNTSPTWQPVTATGAINSVIRQVFENTGTYTPTAGMTYCDIEVIGGGGGGGGCGATGAGTSSCSGGGGGGGYARGIFTAATIGASQAVTIGAAGAGGIGGNQGVTGGTTSVGALISATGGVGGTSSAVSGTPTADGGDAGVGTGGDFQTQGTAGTKGFAYASGGQSQGVGGSGGSTFFGGGGKAGGLGGGVAATSYGGGGGGSALIFNQSANTGGAGYAGLVIVTEYL